MRASRSRLMTRHTQGKGSKKAAAISADGCGTRMRIDDQFLQQNSLFSDMMLSTQTKIADKSENTPLAEESQNDH